MQEGTNPMTNDMRNLLEFSQTLGVLKFVNYKSITNFNLAYHPYLSTREYYETLGRYHLIWNKLFFKISQNRAFITKLFEPLRQKDEMISHLLNIYQKTAKGTKIDGLNFSRCDYYNNLEGKPQLTEYNLMSVGMQSHQQMFQQAKKLSDYQNSHQYTESKTIESFAETISDFSKRKQLKGILLFVIFHGESNLFDQKRLEIEMMKKEIKVKRVTIQDLSEHITTDEGNNLFYDKQLVSFVYYRAGYKFDHFKVNGDHQVGWKVKEDIELSNAYCIPPVSMELINQKRVQTELTKPHVLRQFLPEHEAVELEKTFVKQWQFDTLSEPEFQQLIQMVSMDPGSYILKPNLQGGGNNFYGVEALNKLKSLSLKECQIYILMHKIHSKSSQNSIIDGVNYLTLNCLYQISRYGAFSWIAGQLVTNVVSGFMIRAKPEHANEGGIMTGIGSIVPWKFID